GPGQAADLAPVGEAAEVDALVPPAAGQADAVAQDGAAAEGTGRVHGDDAHPGAPLPVGVDQRADQGALADARRAGDAHDEGVARQGIKRLQDRLAGRLTVLHQGDGAGQGPPVAGPQRLDQLLRCHGHRHYPILCRSRTACRTNSTMRSRSLPGPNTSAPPAAFRAGMSSSGMMPPTATTTSSSPAWRSRSMIRGTRVLWAPERMLRPTTSSSSSTAASTMACGVWRSPV